MSKSEYIQIGERTAVQTAVKNGVEAKDLTVTVPDRNQSIPLRLRVTVNDRISVPRERKNKGLKAKVTAEAMLGAVASNKMADIEGTDCVGVSELAEFQGNRMRGDVKEEFEDMFTAAKKDGVTLYINSAYRSDAQQAILFRKNPNPRMVAPPGKSLHRCGTELDLGPSSAYSWLKANAHKYHFKQRYDWEPWHYGYLLNHRSASAGYRHNGPSVDGHPSIPAFVPAKYADIIADAAQQWNVGAALLSAQLYAESSFNPFAVSPAGAGGIAQFMPATGRAYGLSPQERFDPKKAIPAQARHMRDLLQQFGRVDLALAAYNAGAGAVSRCNCIPQGEPSAYVARIQALIAGTGDASAVQAVDNFTVRLVK
jgi:LAS superfamily LD-carboxypeptidase LdcB